MNNFDLKKFLVENKLTSNSKLNEEVTSTDSLPELATAVADRLFVYAIDTDLEFLDHSFDLGLSDEEAQGPYEGNHLDTAIKNAIIEDPLSNFTLWKHTFYDDDTEEFDLTSWEDNYPKTVARLKEMDIDTAEDEIIQAITKLKSF